MGVGVRVGVAVGVGLGVGESVGVGVGVEVGVGRGVGVTAAAKTFGLGLGLFVICQIPRVINTVPYIAGVLHVIPPDFSIHSLLSVSCSIFTPMYHYGYYTTPRVVSNPSLVWAGFGLHLFFSLLFWAVIIWVIASLFKHHDQTSEPESLEILKTRYAKGEITKKEFEEMKKDLA